VIFLRCSHFISALNIMCNIYIYYVAITSFRQFVNSKFHEIASNIALCFTFRRNERNVHPRTIGQVGLRAINPETQPSSILTSYH
jgi:hypothetical protein